eukprot:760660-Hanusia_phi.AAC.4
MDLLSRLLTDLQVDVSEMMENLLTTSQNHMLRSAFWGNSSSRSRFVLLFTSKIDPLLKAEDYMDRGEYENEMSQVIGQLEKARDFGSKNNFIVIAQRGMLVVGERLRRYDRLIVMLCELIVMNQFAVVLYKWTSNIQNNLHKLRSLTNVRDPNPNHYDEARYLRNETSEDIACLEEIMMNLSSNLKKIHVPPSPFEDFGQKLYNFLDLKKTHDSLTKQIDDLNSFVCCYKAEVRSISINFRTTQNKRERGTVLKLEQETGRMIRHAVSEREQTSIFEIIMGIIAFKFLLVFLDSFITARSRYFGIATLIDSSSNSTASAPTVAGFSVISTSSIGSPLSSNTYFPLQWAIQLDKIPFFTIIMHVVLCSLCLVILARAYRHRRQVPTRDVKVQTDVYVNISNLDAFVLRHKKKRIDVENDFDRHFKKYQYVPTSKGWGASKPRIIVMVDTCTTKLLWASITRNEKLSLWRWLLQILVYRKFSGLSMKEQAEDDLNDILLDEFVREGILANPDAIIAEDDSELPQEAAAEKKDFEKEGGSMEQDESYSEEMSVGSDFEGERHEKADRSFLRAPWPAHSEALIPRSCVSGPRSVPPASPPASATRSSSAHSRTPPPRHCSTAPSPLRASQGHTRSSLAVGGSWSGHGR